MIYSEDQSKMARYYRKKPDLFGLKLAVSGKWPFFFIPMLCPILKLKFMLTKNSSNSTVHHLLYSQANANGSEGISNQYDEHNPSFHQTKDAHAGTMHEKGLGRT